MWNVVSESAKKWETSKKKWREKIDRIKKDGRPKNPTDETPHDEVYVSFAILLKLKEKSKKEQKKWYDDFK